MGYRSQVVIAYTFETQAVADIFSLNAMGKEFEAIHQDLACGEWTKGEDGQVYFVMEFDDVKWYPDFKDVLAHTALLEWVDEEMADSVDAVLVRVGEDDNDVERDVYGNMHGCMDVYVQTSISIDLPDTPIDNPFRKSDEQGVTHE